MFGEPEAVEYMYFNARAFGPMYIVCTLLACLVALAAIVRQSSSGNPPERMAFAEMYDGADSLGIHLSDKLRRLTGQKVRMTGFMAPPLKPTLSFFVLAGVPMSICPFCSSDADWPADIVVVTLDKPADAVPFDRPIWVEGTLEVGTAVDGETGFVSLVRIRADALGEERAL